MRPMRFPRWLGLAALLAWLGMAACAAPYDDALVAENGDQIRLVSIERIVSDPDLTEEQKREALEGLGITDEDLIDLLIDEL